VSRPELNLGEMIQLFYAQYLALYHDEELASVAAAHTINQILQEREDAPRGTSRCVEEDGFHSEDTELCPAGCAAPGGLRGPHEGGEL
jgi:hypothetical protein